MGKIKLNLVSGAIVEKPLISAFLANNNKYVVFDNEMNGSMGLPIILVCKLDANKLTKIIDPNEWNIVKEYLKNIIAGNSVEYFNMDQEVLADDLYYTQLTLPVPSFDALKKAYVPVSMPNDINPFNSSENITPVTVTEMPVMPEAPTIPEAPSTVLQPPVSEIPVTPVEPVVPEINTALEQSPVQPSETYITPNAPISQNEIVYTNETEQAPIVEEPTINPTPVQERVFASQKEAFMKACENMFDALVQKFEEELQKR